MSGTSRQTTEWDDLPGGRQLAEWMEDARDAFLARQDEETREHPDGRLLAASASGELSAGERLRVNVHLFYCDECAEIVQSVQAADAEVHTAGLSHHAQKALLLRFKPTVVQTPRARATPIRPDEEGVRLAAQDQAVPTTPSFEVHRVGEYQVTVALRPPEDRVIVSVERAGQPVTGAGIFLEVRPDWSDDSVAVAIVVTNEQGTADLGPARNLRTGELPGEFELAVRLLETDSREGG